MAHFFPSNKDRHVHISKSDLYRQASPRAKALVDLLLTGRVSPDRQISGLASYQTLVQCFDMLINDPWCLCCAGVHLYRTKRPVGVEK